MPEKKICSPLSGPWLIVLFVAVLLPGKKINDSFLRFVCTEVRMRIGQLLRLSVLLLS